MGQVEAAAAVPELVGPATPGSARRPSGLAGLVGLTGRVASLALLATLGLAPSVASAQEVQVEGPLAGEPAVRHMRVYRSGRIQIQPGFAMTLQDEYSTTMLGTLQLQFHLTDWLGVGVWGGYGVYHGDTSLTDEVVAQGITTDRNRLSLPTAAGFSDQVGRISSVAAGQATFIPLRGKLALFQTLFVDTDFYLFGGVALVGVEERADVTSTVCATVGNPACVASQSARSTRFSLAPTFGAGLTMYFNDFIGLSLEWRGLPFAWNTSGTDESGHARGDFPDGEIDGDDRIFHFNHLFQLGVVIYLPTAAEITD